jgi:2-octaprenyl-6-methoxyphenol hydroxylase
VSVYAEHGAHVTQPREDSRQIAVVGGGLVGMSLAVALGRAGISVSLIEASNAQPRSDSAYDSRPIALSQCSRRILDTLGVWDALGAAATPITRIHVSDRGHFGFARMCAEDHGVDALGYVASAAALGQALEEVLACMPGVCVLRPAVIDQVEREHLQVVRLSVAASGPGPAGDFPSRLEAKLMALCDGGRSPLRERLGIHVNERDYGQWAVTARVTARCAHGGVAYERFTSGGPLAMLPMQGNDCGLVWSMDADSSERLLALDDEGFLRALGEQFGMRLGGFVASGPRSAFPVRLSTASEVIGERLAIIGNAANRLHPVAGQGLNLGLRDAAALAEIVTAALREGGDPGDPSALARYAAWRRDDQKRVSRATDGLVRLFSNSFAPLVLARGLGLLAFDLFPPAKRRFGNHAMGLSGRQSRLARGLPL